MCACINNSLFDYALLLLGFVATTVVAWRHLHKRQLVLSPQIGPKEISDTLFYCNPFAEELFMAILLLLLFCGLCIVVVLIMFIQILRVYVKWNRCLLGSRHTIIHCFPQLLCIIIIIIVLSFLSVAGDNSGR